MIFGSFLLQDRGSEVRKAERRTNALRIPATVSDRSSARHCVDQRRRDRLSSRSRPVSAACSFLFHLKMRTVVR